MATCSYSQPRGLARGEAPDRHRYRHIVCGAGGAAYALSIQRCTERSYGFVQDVFSAGL
jgi:hypothetical protein